MDVNSSHDRPRKADSTTGHFEDYATNMNNEWRYFIKFWSSEQHIKDI